MMITTDPNRWYYRGERSNTYTDKLNPGDIIIARRRPYRVREITPRPHINWNERYLAAWERSGRPDPDTWRHRPFALVLTAEDKPDSRQQFHCEAAGSQYWTVLPEHYVICRLCGELPPCRHEHTEAVMDRALAEMDEAMRLLPGSCHECGALIRPRQHTIRFEGTNLIRPDLGDDSAVFHTARQKCWSGAYLYDAKWAAAVPGRRRKMACEGMTIRHLDGTFECTTGEDCLMDEGRHQGASVQHWVGQGVDCWCLTGGPRPTSTVASVDDDRLF